MIHTDSLFVRNDDKNTLIQQRPGGMGVSFEDVVQAIANDMVIEDGYNIPNYPHQRYMIVLINDYPYKVPYYIDEIGSIHLITAYPTRKHK